MEAKAFVKSKTIVIQIEDNNNYKSRIPNYQVKQ
jgi:hypothetical protein